MGAAPELGAVTDAHGSVHGVEGLTVADASIMPTVPTGTPNLPTIMVAEHIARWLRCSCPRPQVSGAHRTRSESDRRQRQLAVVVVVIRGMAIRAEAGSGLQLA